MTEAVPAEVQHGERQQEENDADPENPDPSGSAGRLGPAKRIRHAELNKQSIAYRQLGILIGSWRAWTA
jgi:hypothetical protein